MEHQFSRVFSSPRRRLDCDERDELERGLRSASLAYSRSMGQVFGIRERMLKLQASDMADQAKRMYQLARIALKNHRRVHGC
jgi:hypothetical protein